ncbi:hypothetical protein [Curtobacterium aurantiacum]|uniref:Uncharacterized protein n=1 Tax=Curtobacterium aurantiacum TaxID=3236919 RepID=A0ABS5VJB8_9MICO|nr:hypothetical protein [Curtobacterium flaccumfaciens]MBT1546279.1 hypothetical protein [Curtobacterium flaccumfaciens pv. flaccumfaciens]MBT1589212.1 hypothetical protein [Curtobacterium flaccumfaciens pv. flaccumfaciens]MBT1680913.1 hypothetical protein [Curtobacterium flaccumfaciens pv. flaccumfaciens]
MKAARIVLVVIGVLVIAFGAYVLVTSVKPNRIGGLGVWLLAAVVLHDAVLSPFVVGAGLLLRRAGGALRVWVLVVVQVAIVLGSVLALVVLPEIVAKDDGPKNPTVLPFDYGTRLLLVEGALLVVVVVVLVVGVVLARRPAASSGSSAVRTTG